MMQVIDLSSSKKMWVIGWVIKIWVSFLFLGCLAVPGISGSPSVANPCRDGHAARSEPSEKALSRAGRTGPDRGARWPAGLEFVRDRAGERRPRYVSALKLAPALYAGLELGPVFQG